MAADRYAFRHLSHMGERAASLQLVQCEGEYSSPGKCVKHPAGADEQLWSGVHAKLLKPSTSV